MFTQTWNTAHRSFEILKSSQNAEGKSTTEQEKEKVKEREKVTKAAMTRTEIQESLTTKMKRSGKPKNWLLLRYPISSTVLLTSFDTSSTHRTRNRITVDYDAGEHYLLDFIHRVTLGETWEDHI